MVNCRCPYCDKEVSYIKAMSIRRRGEYYCPKCHKESNIYIKKMIWVGFFAAVIVALLILGFFLILTEKDNIAFVFIVIIPFIFFYIATPAFVRLRPKKKFQDSLYDTEMVNNNMVDPDPTMSSSKAVAPSFVDDIVLGDDDYKPAINSDIFNAIKEERKVVEETNGGTRSFDRFENISSNEDIGNTRPVENLKNIGRSTDAEVGSHFDLSEFD